mmetsp:Transcript_39122/g.71922  ORF Transcript_39122/g.71922 Transcript_39122/m.71922 type:complete len:270 (+) Transcript_39122:1130-1939(+)
MAHQLGAVLVRAVAAKRGAYGALEAATNRQAQVLKHVSHHLEKLLPEHLRRVFFFRAQALDEGHHVRVAARDALPHDLKAARHNVGALHGNGDGHAQISARRKVHVPAANPGPAQHVHAVEDDAPAPLRARLLHDAGNHHGRLVVVDDAVHQVRARHADQRLAAHARQHLLDPAEFRDGDLELLAHAAVRPHARHQAFRGGDRARGEGDATALREALDKHVPPEPTLLLASEDVVHWDPHVVALHGSVHERRHQGNVPWPHAQTLVLAL